MTSIRELYIHELRDLCSVEHQALAALPRMIGAARDPDLREVLEAQRRRIDRQLARLDKIFLRLHADPGDQVCRGMESLIAEADSAIRERTAGGVRDAAIVAEAQRMTHYEIAGYGVARAFAEQLGDFEAADLLQETLIEEGLADQSLSYLAERRLSFEPEMRWAEVPSRGAPL